MARVLIFIIVYALRSCMASTAQIDEFAMGVSSFASDFYHQNSESQPDNFVISPYSVASALALLSQATSGTTFDELKIGLHLTGNKSNIGDQYISYNKLLKNGTGCSNLTVANQLYIQKGYTLNKYFQNVTVPKFLSGVKLVDFTKPTETADAINHFIEEKTHHKIKNVIQPESLDGNSLAVLVNAVYLKANWQYEFTMHETSKGNFYSNHNENNSVDFMHTQAEFNYGNLPDLNATALELSYFKSELSFLILLPNDKDGLSALEAKLRKYGLTKIINQMTKQMIKVSIPKFKVESEVKLNDILQNLGITEIFQKDKANFSGLLYNKEKVFISNAVHRAFIEVNEEGTEAAAATVFSVIPYLLEFEISNTPIFRADHPFIYHIWDNNTKSVIFSGRITKL